MSGAPRTEEILQKAKEEEKRYEWLKAVDYYQEALTNVADSDYLRKGEITENLAYSIYKAAFQADSNHEFKERIAEAKAGYSKAKASYAESDEPGKTPRISRCEASIALMNYWLNSEASEKKKLLNECWRLGRKALEAFESAEAALDYGKTFNQLSTGPIFEFTLESDFDVRVQIMEEAVKCGEKAVKFLHPSGDIIELARAYARTVVCLVVFGYYCKNIRHREPYFQRAQEFWQKAKELSEETARTESLFPVFGGQSVFGLEGSDEALSNYKKALDYSEKTRDGFLIGCAEDWLAYHTFWMEMGLEDIDEMTRLLKTIIPQYIQGARDHFSKISFASPRSDSLWIEAYTTETDLRLAGIETEVSKKRDMLEKALKTAPDMLKKAENFGYPEVINYANHVYGLVLFSLAKIETKHDEKKRLLEQALHYVEEESTTTEQLYRLAPWNRGITQGSLGAVKSNLAEVAEDPETKKNLLQEAALAADCSVKLMIEEMTFSESKQPGSTSLYAAIGRSQSGYGDLLNRLYGLTLNRDYLERTVQAFEEASESFQKLNLNSRIAECHWKIARAYDALDEHSNAAQYFSSASNDYRSAAESIPQLKVFYQDYARYMEAWSEIEKAKHHHQKQEYRLAEEHFQNAANMHESLKRWDYLAGNYSAWAYVERAEDLSRKEQCEKALQAFEEATSLFEDSKKSMQDGLGRVEDATEKQMAMRMIKATDPRRRYCNARIAIEEARILDKKGDHRASSEKYSSAATTLQKIIPTAESEQERTEFNLISTLSKAWAKMTQAEAESSPERYLEASKLFDEAKELSTNEKAKMLALGHSHFCRALEAGTRFVDSRDATLHAAAIQHLETAATYYVKAEFHNASEYAKATKLLLDAYEYMSKAQIETDAERQARIYAMAEKILQTSAGAYTKAEHPEKSEEVQRLLEKVREERELAISLTEVLHAPTIVSTTEAFETPIPSKEEAVGLERFEHADIQANLITHQKELKVGENLNIEIELVNAGKGPAVLTKITEVVPEGFDLTQKPEAYRLEDSYLNMKGKRLYPLKTEELKLVLKSKVRGVFQVKPTILYLDENGQYKTHEPQPVTITVKELGIKGWLKGES